MNPTLLIGDIVERTSAKKPSVEPFEDWNLVHRLPKTPSKMETVHDS